MTTAKKHILVTNDDGVQAPGLLALAQAMRGLGEVTVLAPDRNWSASGHVKTLSRPLRVQPVTLADGTAALATDGAPSDSVALALLGIVEQPIDLVVSGINPYANLGHDVTYSGTVTAAMEAVIGGLPGLAVSLDTPEDFTGQQDYAPAAELARRAAAQILVNGLPKYTLLSLNVPFLPLDQIKGIQPTRQGLRVYHDALVRANDPRGKPYYWIGGSAPTGVPDPGTDVGALAEGYAALTPLQLDLTAYSMIDTLAHWTL
jgi:5'-nucleotidase